MDPSHPYAGSCRTLFLRRRRRSMPRVSLLTLVTLIAGLVQGVSMEPTQDNLIPDPGFDHFEGDLPTGWTASVWNARTTRVKYGKLAPGRDGTGTCLEIQPTTPMSVGTLRGRAFPAAPSTGYLFKGHYASASELVTADKRWMDAEGVSLTGQWQDEDGEVVGSFTIVLPSTQDRWIEVFEEVRSPETTRALQIAVEWRWTGGRLRLDDFSLREGSIADFSEEFTIQPADDESFFPIFGWLIPFPGIMERGSYGPDLESGPDATEDRLLAEYALANFNLGNEGTARFGTRFWAQVPDDDERLVELTRSPLFWGFHGPDEPGEERFSELAAVNRRIQQLAPGAVYWVNHLPTYGFGSEDMLAEYDSFIQAYIDTVQPQLFTYDHYCLMGNPQTQAESWYSPNREQDYFPNLEIVRERALEADIDFGVIVSVGTFGGVRGATEAELRWQAFTTLAYGSRLLGWFCYLTEVNYGHWTNWEDMVINRDGTRTRHYAMLKYLNAEVLNWGPTLLRLTSTGVFHTDPLLPRTHPVDESRLVETLEGGMALLGEFEDAEGRDHLMIVNRDYGDPVSLQVRLRQPCAGVSRLSRQTGACDDAAAPGPVTAYSPATGQWRVSLAAGDAELFRLELQVD